MTLVPSHTKFRSFFHAAIVRIIAGLFICLGVIIIVQKVFSPLFNMTSLPEQIKSLSITMITVIAIISAYRLLYKYYEQRDITELGISNMMKDTGLGVILGFLLQTFTILVIYLIATYKVIEVNGLSSLLPAITISLSSSIIEEILFRGIIFRITEEKLGTFIALLISALLFGALHYTNPGSSFIAALGLALQAGVLLGLCYTYTKSLWLPIGLHFGWNFTQSGIYGARVSGIDVGQSLFESEISGPAMVTGGAFGPEGSVQATVFCLLVSVGLYVLSKKRGHWVKPMGGIESQA